MNRIARLEADDGLPTAAFELGARLRRRQGLPDRAPVGSTVTVPPSKQLFALVHRGNAGMLFLFGAIDVSRFERLIVGINFFDVDDAAKVAFAVVQRGAGRRDAGAPLRDPPEHDGNRPRQAVCEPHVVDDVFVIILTHKAGQRAECAIGNELKSLISRPGERQLAQPWPLHATLAVFRRTANRSTNVPPCGAIMPMPSLSPARSRAFRLGKNRRNALLDGFRFAIDGHVGMFGRFVRIGDAGEVLQLAGNRFGVEALHVTPR